MNYVKAESRTIKGLIFVFQAQVAHQLAGVPLQSWDHSFPQVTVEVFEETQNHGIKVCSVGLGRADYYMFV